MEYLSEEYKNGEVFHDAINLVLGKRTKIPHEWYFINVLSKEVLNNNELATKFVMYIAQYAFHYPWVAFHKGDYLTTVLLECEFYSFMFKKYYEFGLKYETEQWLKPAMMFGEIVTDFLIRYCGYSLIKSSGQQIIQTAHSDCHKRFFELLKDGYSLQWRSKVGYIKLEQTEENLTLYPGVNGYFYKLPVLPTKDIGYPVEELIENSSGEYCLVLHNK